MLNRGSAPILNNCTLSDNSAELGNALACYSYEYESNIELINCIIWNGGNEIWNEYGSPIIITYSNIQGGQASIVDPCEAVIWGEGNVDVDPLFANPGYWANADGLNAVWIDGDYHLKSQAGRWDPNSQSWIMDDITSPCIDAGDPNSPIGDEPEPNGSRINMGAYGGTAEASKSDMSELVQTTQRLIRASRFKAVK